VGNRIGRLYWHVAAASLAAIADNRVR
jgi:hypothetical protein